jgi:hypothetical protein
MLAGSTPLVKMVASLQALKRRGWLAIMQAKQRNPESGGRTGQDRTG